MCFQTIQDLFDLLESVAVIAAAVVAAFGVNSWRREHVGKRQLELAEEVLAMFYEAQDAVRAIRSPFGYTNEGRTRKPETNETASQKEWRDRAFVTIERSQQFSPLLSKIRSARYRFIAIFGTEAGEPFLELNRLINELHWAANDYSEHMDHGVHLDTENETTLRERQEESTKLRRILHEFPSRPDRPDEFGDRLKTLIETIERTCKPIIMSYAKQQRST